MKQSFLPLGLAALLALAGCGAPEPASPVRIAEPIVTLPAVPGRPGALYFRIDSDEGEVSIAAITSPRAGRIELHESLADANGVVRMRKLEKAAAAPGRPLLFEPGGKHAMLFDLDPALKAGDTLPLVIRLEPEGSLTASAEVKGPGAAAHDGH